MTRPFTDAEYAARLRRVQAVMAERSLAALVVADPANLYYLTGYNAWSFYTPQCLVVPAAGLPHLFARAMDAAGRPLHGLPAAATRSTATARTSCTAPTCTPSTGSPTGPLELGAGRGRRRGGDRASRWTRHFFSAARLPGAAEPTSATRPAGGLAGSWSTGCGLVKSPAEQEQLRAAGAIAERAMATALDAVAPGRRQCDVVAEILAAQARGTPTHGRRLPGGRADAADRRDGGTPRT